MTSMQRSLESSAEAQRDECAPQDGRRASLSVRCAGWFSSWFVQDVFEIHLSLLGGFITGQVVSVSSGLTMNG